MKLKWKILLAVGVVLLVIFLLGLTGVIQAGSLKEMWDKNPLLCILLAPILLMVWFGNKLAGIGKKSEDFVTLPTGEKMTKEEYLQIRYDWLVENYPEYYTEEGAQDLAVSIEIDEEAGTVTYINNETGSVITVEKTQGLGGQYNVR